MTFRSMVLAVIGSVLLTHSAAAAHATLLATEPAAGSTLTTAPSMVRLLFNEAIELGLSRITLVSADNHSVVLKVRGDPHDVHAAIAALDSLGPGTYQIQWRVVSADGHPVGGTFSFSVRSAESAATAAPIPAPPPPTTTPVQPESAEGWGPMLARAPVIAAVLRGLAVGSLMALTGLLLFIVLGGEALSPVGRTTLSALAIAAPILLLAHAIVWLIGVAPDQMLDADTVQAALATPTGGAEAVRIVLAALALWAVALARRMKLGLVFASGAIVASAVIGHPAAVHPAWSIPLKGLHLVAAAAWLGGLLWLIAADADSDGRLYVSGVGRVSSVALWAVVVILVTGVVEALVFVPSIGRLLLSAYGAILLAKLAGLGILVVFGAYHWYRVLPKLATGGVVDLQRSVRWEIAVMAIVLLLGGWLAYVPPPQLLY